MCPLHRVLGERRVGATGRGPVQLVREDREREQPGEEDRQGDAGQRDGHRRTVEDAALAQRRQQADGHPGHRPQDRRADRQRHRHGQPVGQVRPDRVLGQEGVPEAGRRTVHGDRPGVVVGAEEDGLGEPPVLHVDRVEEAQLLGQLVQLGGIGGLAGVPRRHVVGRRTGQAGYQEEDRERHHAHDEEHQNGGEQPPDDVSDHSIRPVVAGEVDPRRPPVAFTFLQVSGNYFTPIQA